MWAFAALCHYYLTPQTANKPTYANSNVAVTLPLWTFNMHDSTSGGENYGANALNVVKVSMKGTVLEEYVGFFIPRGTPFMHADGKHRIQVIGGDSAYKCWIYGHYYTSANANKHESITTYVGVRNAASFAGEYLKYW